MRHHLAMVLRRLARLIDQTPTQPILASWGDAAAADLEYLARIKGGET